MRKRCAFIFCASTPPKKAPAPEAAPRYICQCLIGSCPLFLKKTVVKNVDSSPSTGFWSLDLPSQACLDLSVEKSTGSQSVGRLTNSPGEVALGGQHHFGQPVCFVEWSLRQHQTGFQVGASTITYWSNCTCLPANQSGTSDGQTDRASRCARWTASGCSVTTHLSRPTSQLSGVPGHRHLLVLQRQVLT